ncbi:hypothetical protein BACPLE_03352 [Phocaeicola plebeius DSM 17135]|uniref:Uncharacterized protein n=1 Tax=Phocaeicola plebeius (strain DSM 17135 / JCM 12973 / CCUG 54634 / M2) TaxID=484018 RepID=B5D2W2_PHOPM|nr:hypothetical protein BACPLE_03352 [Phocaeicola plebeius DSM 17135]
MKNVIAVKALKQNCTCVFSYPIPHVAHRNSVFIRYALVDFLLFLLPLQSSIILIQKHENT